jgi:DNA-binding winged helix-turn-helix (wHTH) protein
MIYIWDDFSLDTGRYRLYRAGGLDLHLEPLTFDLLLYLLENHERVVTWEELRVNVWKTHVGFDALYQAIRGLRSVLQDDPKAPRYIQTVHRRGCRFIGEVFSAEVTEQPTRQTWLNTLGALIIRVMVMGRRAVETPLTLIRTHLGRLTAIPVPRRPGVRRLAWVAVVVLVVMVYSAWLASEVLFLAGPGNRPGTFEGAQIPRDPSSPPEESPHTLPSEVSPPTAETPIAPMAQDHDPTPEVPPPTAEAPAPPTRPVQGLTPKALYDQLVATLRATGWWCRQPRQSPCLRAVQVRDMGVIRIVGVLCAHQNLHQLLNLLRPLPGVTAVVLRDVNILQSWSDALPQPRPLPPACAVPPWNHKPRSTP